MFDALTQIGSPEAISGFLKAAITADPREITLLSQNPRKLEPAQHRQRSLGGAASPSHGECASGASDVAPLFQVLQSYGGPAVIRVVNGSQVELLWDDRLGSIP